MTKVASCERFPSPVLVEKQQRKTSSSTCYLEPPRALSGRWAAGQAPGTSAQELFRPSRKFRQHFSLTVRKKSGETSGFRFLPYGPGKNRAPNRGPAPGDSLEAVSGNFLGAPIFSSISPRTGRRNLLENFWTGRSRDKTMLDRMPPGLLPLNRASSLGSGAAKPNFKICERFA